MLNEGSEAELKGLFQEYKKQEQQALQIQRTYPFEK